MEKKYTLVSEEERFHTPRMKAVKVTYESEDRESKIEHTIIRSKPSVAVIILDDDNRVALIKQFRTTTGEYYWEIPAGLIEEGETLTEAASREAEEEAGLKLQDIWKLSYGPNLLDPSKSDEDYGVCMAHLAGTADRHLDEQEVIESKITWMPMDEVYERLYDQIDQGKPFCDNLSMSGHSIYSFLILRFLEE